MGFTAQNLSLSNFRHRYDLENVERDEKCQIIIIVYLFIGVAVDIFHAKNNVFTWDISKPIFFLSFFFWKKRENIPECCLLKFLSSMLSIHPDPSDPSYTLLLQTV